jgi:hypothetical protein
MVLTTISMVGFDENNDSTSIMIKIIEKGRIPIRIDPTLSLSLKPYIIGDIGRIIIKIISISALVV